MRLRTLLLIAALGAAPLPALAETHAATIVAGHPPVFRWVRMITESFIPEVEARLEGTGHDMIFSTQFGGAIAGVGEELETIELGLAEIGTVQSLFDPAKLAVQNVTYYTPFVSDDVRLVAGIMEALHEEERMLEAYAANGVAWLGAPIIIDDYLLMTTFPVTSLEDLAGRKIAAPGPAVNWLSGTGAVPVSGNLTTYYNEIATGVYDGVLVFASAALPGKLHEVAPYVTRMGLGAQYAGALGANADWFAGLPYEIQTALQGAAEAAGRWYLDDLDVAVAAAFETMAAEGATVTDATPEMRSAWAAGMDNAAAAWAAELDAKGEPATDILGLYMEGMRAAGAAPLRDWDRE
jgi:TRAP-type C4-dicarboxylate transport system substrate-binding protein